MLGVPFTISGFLICADRKKRDEGLGNEPQSFASSEVWSDAPVLLPKCKDQREKAEQGSH